MSFLNDRRFRGLRQLWRTGEGPALLASLLFCLVTAYLIEPLLPAEEGFAMVGVLFIYATVFVLAAGIFRMAIRPVMKRMQRASAAKSDGTA